MLRLKSFFLLMILLWAGVSPAPAVPAFSELRQMASFSPKEVLVLADSLYDEVAYPHYKLDYIKACAYFRLSMFTQALHTAEHAYNSVEIKSDSLLYSRIFMILAEASVFSYSIEKAARYIQKGKAYATASGNDMLMGNLMNAEGYLYRRLGLPRKAYECTLGAVNLLNEAEGEERAFHLSRAYGFLMRYYISDRKFQEAWQTGLIRNQVIGGLKPFTWTGQPVRLSVLQDGLSCLYAWKRGGSCIVLQQISADKLFEDVCGAAGDKRLPAGTQGLQRGAE